MKKSTPNILIDSEQVQKFLEYHKTLDNYFLQEESLNKLFSLFPSNTNIEEVLIKVCCLNQFYSTNIYDVYTLSKHIVSLKIDKRLAQGDLTLVKDISKVTMKNGKTKNFYSFATKFVHIMTLKTIPFMIHL